MKKFDIVTKVNRSFHKAGFQLKKHSPEILVVTGVIGVVTSAVLACKATRKLDSVLEESKEQIDKIKDYIEEEGYSEEYTEKDASKDLTITYTQSALKIAKLYGPSVILGAASIGAIFGGHNILRKRNVALAAAYTAVDKGFKDYRNRVIELFGKEKEREHKYKNNSSNVKETELEEDANEKTSKVTVNTVDPNELSEFARFYDDGCTGWTKDPELNLVFLKKQQCWANDLLKSRGWLTLNEVYDMLGITRTAAGMVVGWIYDEKHPVGDNFVDFGIYDINNEANRRFVNGLERTILLDFNVDGNIYDKI